jgi:transglutaminase-like putative cysteine protease
VLLCCVSSSAAAGLGAALPYCWSRVSSYTADVETRKGFGERFGVELVSLTNEKIDAGGLSLQVNTVECKRAEDAATVHEFFMSARNADFQKYIRAGNVVYEFMCDNHAVRAKTQDLMGLRARQTREYRVTMEIAPLISGDDTRWNELFNALMNDGDVAGLAPSFEFGSSLVLRNERPEWGTPSYSFANIPREKKTAGDHLKVSFDDLTVVAGVPRVIVDVFLAIKPFSPYRPPEPINTYELTKATAAWPTDHPQVERVFADGWDDAWTTLEKIEYLHCWAFENIAYEGDIVGSRYGTARVLEQRYGHCWDKSDVFITLCRRAGIPARQVMGWHFGLEQGHVWAQAYEEPQGWISIDATASWLGVNDHYVPLFILEDGRVPFVYAAMPQVDLVIE